MLKICVGCIPNFISFDSNGGISCNASRFSYFKSVNFLEILLSPSSFNNSSSSFLTFSFNIFISFVFSFADNLNSLSFSKSCGFFTKATS